MAHLVLQLSARSEAALVEMASRYHNWLENLDDEQFSSFCQTTLVRPQGHDHRATLVARSRSEMMHHLSSFTSATPSPNVFAGHYCELPKRKCVFTFPNSGMASLRSVPGLAEVHPCIHETLSQCDQAVQETLLDPIGFRLVELCEHAASPDARALPFVHFGIQLAIARLWQKAGFEPDAVVGVGIGQIASCVVAGAIDIKGAIARIAVLNHFELAPAASACLAQSHPFIIDCYSPSGKNVTPAVVRTVHECPDALADIPRWKAVDYFLQSLDEAQIDFCGNDIADSVVAALDAQSFWLELARLSVRYNVQWKCLLPRPRLIHPLPYPWQHSRFWLESSQAPKTPAALLQTVDAHSSSDGPEECGNSDLTSAGNISNVESGHTLTAPGHVVSNLNRQKLLNLPESERRSVLASYLKQKVAETLRLSANDMEEPQTFAGLGIDSLTALKLKNQVEADLNLPISLVKLLDGRSIGDLATDLLSSSFEPNPSAVQNSLPQLEEGRFAHEHERAPNGELTDYLASIPPEEIDQMLGELLNSDSAP